MKDTTKMAAKSSDLQKKHTSPKIVPSQARSKPVDQQVYLQRAIGNQTIQRLHKSGAIQAKLTIGQPNDKYEQEADRITEQITPLVQRQTEPEKEEEEEILQPRRRLAPSRKPSPTGAVAVTVLVAISMRAICDVVLSTT